MLMLLISAGCVKRQPVYRFNTLPLPAQKMMTCQMCVYSLFAVPLSGLG